MTSWKVLLGVGGACAACCALPIAATVTALFAGATGGLAVASGSVLQVAGVVAMAGLAGAGFWWNRHRLTKETANACGPSSRLLPACDAITPAKQCGCGPGPCG